MSYEYAFKNGDICFKANDEHFDELMELIESWGLAPFRKNNKPNEYVFYKIYDIRDGGISRSRHPYESCKVVKFPYSTIENVE